jgi:hypothetical protein
MTTTASDKRVAVGAATAEFLNDFTIRRDAAYLIHYGVPIGEVAARITRHQRYVRNWGMVSFWIWFYAAIATAYGCNFLIQWSGMFLIRGEINPLKLWGGVICLALGVSLFYGTALTLVWAWRRACAGIPHVDARSKWRIYHDKDRGMKGIVDEDPADALRKLLVWAITIILGSAYCYMIAAGSFTGIWYVLREAGLVQ